MNDTPKSLKLKFHGRILDHLGLQMYQKPIAALAELVSNAWDADAENVWIIFPESLDDNAEIIIKDNGIGMTLDECQNKYLNVGWCRRKNNPDERSLEKNRPILGRKGLGKFAGFGIAEIIIVETTSKSTGEYTEFELDINNLRSEEFINDVESEIPVIRYIEPTDDNIKEHGTTIILKKLNLLKRLSEEIYSKSLSRRFLLHRRAADFNIYLNSRELQESESPADIQYIFPRDYEQSEKPENLSISNEWGIEHLSTGREIKWRIAFYKETIKEDDLQGISVFAKGKLVQNPFFFNLSGGLGGQHGKEYLSGQVEADYIDLMPEDIIAPERQRLRWEHSETIPLEDWGQNRVKQLLRIWRLRRGEARRLEIEEKVAGFSDRLEKLESHERRTVKTALKKLGSIPSISDEQFQEIGKAILRAWEQGRLRELIDAIAQEGELTTDKLLEFLNEAEVLVALNLAEVVKTKFEAIRSLEQMIEKGELENKVRDYIAEKPYLIHPKWETFRKEVSVKHILDEAAEEAGLKQENGDESGGERKRIDLALKSHEHLLVVEFVRPGKSIDYEHLARCKRYIHLVRAKVESQTALGIINVTGLVVADRIERHDDIRREIKDMKIVEIYVYDWKSLLAEAQGNYSEFIDIVAERAPEDSRLQSLRNVE